MTIITAKSASNFVAQAKFPKAPVRRRTRGMTAEPPLHLKASEAQTMVVGTGLVVAAEKVPVQVREDLINCTLFAQLAASGEVEDPTQVNAWYDAYFRALTTWARHRATPTTKPTNSTASTPRRTEPSSPCSPRCWARRPPCWLF